jgi:hypothetical protein
VTARGNERRDVFPDDADGDRATLFKALTIVPAKLRQAQRRQGFQR